MCGGHVLGGFSWSAFVAFRTSGSNRLSASINGQIYYETPTGELSVTDPYTNGNKATEQIVGADGE